MRSISTEQRPRVIRAALAALLLAALPAIAAAAVAFDFGEAHIDRATREVVITGPYTCDAGNTATLTAVLLQGSQQAGDTVSLICDGAPHTWEVRLPLGSPPFHPGPATLEFGVSFTEPGGGGGVSGRSIDIFIAANP